MAVTVFEDRLEKGDWRVEYFDDDGTCYLTLFAGPEAEQRARAYHAAPRSWHSEAHVRRGTEARLVGCVYVASVPALHSLGRKPPPSGAQ